MHGFRGRPSHCGQTRGMEWTTRRACQEGNGTEVRSRAEADSVLGCERPAGAPVVTPQWNLRQELNETASSCHLVDLAILMPTELAATHLDDRDAAARDVPGGSVADGVPGGVGPACCQRC